MTPLVENLCTKIGVKVGTHSDAADILNKILVSIVKEIGDVVSTKF
jgi:hypothetical protein